jgi:hypothetical protein
MAKRLGSTLETEPSTWILRTPTMAAWGIPLRTTSRSRRGAAVGRIRVAARKSSLSSSPELDRVRRRQMASRTCTK